MLEYNVYFKLLHPTGTSEIGVIFEIPSSAPDAGLSESADIAPEQPTDISEVPESTVVMDVMGA